MMESEAISYSSILGGLIMLTLIIIFPPNGISQWLIAFIVMFSFLGIGGFGLAVNYKFKTYSEKPSSREVKS